MAYIEVQNLSHTYPDGTRALKDVSFSLEKGSQTAVLGGNGTGKSTLFLLLSGLLNHSHGRIILDGKAAKGGRKRNSPFEKVGMTFQNPDTQIFAPTVFQEVSFGPVNQRLPEEEILRRTEEALEHTALTVLKDRPVHYLSYGQKKRVTIADILAMKTDILILDEPFAWLDRKSCDEMMKVLQFLRDEGKTLLISTHDSDFAWEWADSVLVFSENRLADQGGIQDLFRNKELLDSAGICQPGGVSIARALNWKGELPRTLASMAETIEKRKGTHES
jgi:cobalt/nickel transport system ATP-binding protein